ncbi:DUF1178 domain-containing protein [Desulfonema ishimotonii]|uniref:DUF1178 domain-containing protein n=1 Tax=Desulfonema ishimotonii TaxID=45657 RepID=A0A401G1S1_9BACT|nr:DUF1178 family protein [Desulfonema ishimotonii]GBC63188.1 DUF1178 domain-containing protein [Desulfonema ishimotonii]
MIVFDLRCASGHQFEGWFEDLQAYEDQRAGALIVCPVCNSSTISRMPSAFAIRSSPKSDTGAPPREILERIGHTLSEFADTHFDDVGCDFAREALKIHYGASEPRNIRGNSTPDEEKTLEEEGVRFFKFPPTPRSDPDT